jgi:hypothetical protein
LSNARYIEQQLGLERYIELAGLCERLISQALPPYCPLYHLPNGDLLIAMDNMITAFIQNKMDAIAAHLSPACPLQFEHVRKSCKRLRHASITLEQLISESAAAPSRSGGIYYEHRRA